MESIMDDVIQGLEETQVLLRSQNFSISKRVVNNNKKTTTTSLEKKKVQTSITNNNNQQHQQQQEEEEEEEEEIIKKKKKRIEEMNERLKYDLDSLTISFSQYSLKVETLKTLKNVIINGKHILSFSSSDQFKKGR